VKKEGTTRCQSQVVAALEVDLVVLPNTSNRRGDRHQLWRFVLRQAHIIQPLCRRVVATILVEPVTVEDGEVDLARQAVEHGLEGWQGWPQATGALAVPAGKLEAEIEQPLGVVYRVAHLLGVG